MSTTNINIRTDTETKANAKRIFATLGLDMTTAVNLFLRQTVRLNDLPFVISTKAAQSVGENKPVYGRGCLKGKMRMAEDFDAPLDDFKDYMQ